MTSFGFAESRPDAIPLLPHTAESIGRGLRRLHPIEVIILRCSFVCLLVLLSLPICSVLCGCTIGAEPATPSLTNTTSAEQIQRLFWDDVKQDKWQPVQGLLTANLVWRNGKDVLTRDQVVPYLQQMQVKDFLITNLTVRSNDDDMTVVYDLQITTARSPQPVNLHAVAIWHQIPPAPENASKQQKKEAQKLPTYLLTVEDLVPDSAGQ